MEEIPVGKIGAAGRAGIAASTELHLRQPEIIDHKDIGYANMDSPVYSAMYAHRRHSMRANKCYREQSCNVVIIILVKVKDD